MDAKMGAKNANWMPKWVSRMAILGVGLCAKSGVGANLDV